MNKGEVWFVEFPLEEDESKSIDQSLYLMKIFLEYYQSRLQNTKPEKKILMIYQLFIGKKQV